MKIGLVGPSYQEESLPFDAQRSINCYAVLDKEGKEVASLYGTPGKKLFTNLGSAPMRMLFYSTTGRAFAVCGSQFFEVNAAGAGTVRGNLDQSAGMVYVEENPIQLALCDGQSLYIFTFATNTFRKIVGGIEYVTNGTFASGASWTTGAGWAIAAGIASATVSNAALSQNIAPATPLVNGRTYLVSYTVTRSAGSVQIALGGTNGVSRAAAGNFLESIVAGATQVLSFTGTGFTGSIDNVSVNDLSYGLPTSIGSITFLDSFFIVNQNATGKFFKSAANNGETWPALDFATAESSPDNLLRPIAAVGQLWLMGTKTGEVWTNTGASAFPFQKVSGGKMNMGIYAPATALEEDNTLFWVGTNQDGGVSAYRANGLVPRQISTEAIDIMLEKATDGAEMRAYTRKKKGHLFYIVTGGGLETTLVYDVKTDMWHEIAYLNQFGVFEQDLGCCYMNAFGKQLVGDRVTGNIYEIDEKTYTDNGAALVMERIYTHLSDESKRIRYNSLVIGAESGLGTQTGQGFDPVIELQLSKDGARTWSPSFREPIGKAGAYKNKAQFRRLGVTDQMTFKIRISDPVPRRITGSYLE